MTRSDQMLDFDAARARLLAQARVVAEVEEVDTLAARGRVLALDQRSTVDVPPRDHAAMDGYALRVGDVPEPGTRLPVSQRIAAGSVGLPLTQGTAARIFTGAPVPLGANAVVMQELCEAGEGEVVINHLPREGEAIHGRGEDMRAGGVVLPAGRLLRPQDLGVAAGAGLARLPVLRRLKVAVFFTGNELVMPGEPLPEGGIYNSNRYMLRALLEGLGCVVTDFGIVPDKLDATRGALRRAAVEHDLIVTSGGVSVGEEDHVKPAVEAEGVLEMWKVAMKPGKPLAYGRVGEADFLGLPGNPVSSFVTFLMLARPFVRARQGVDSVDITPLALRADFDWPKADRRREFLRGRRNGAGGVDLFPLQGPHILSSTSWADGLVDVPPGTPIARGDAVRFLPFSDLLD